MLKLYIGNKNYSSWSMRPWVFMRQAGIVFEEVPLRFDSFEAGSRFKTAIGSVNPVGKVPALVDGDLVVWDSLAIAEYLAEACPSAGVWPTDRSARAQARSICAEMHSGFSSLRSHCPMNIEAHLPAVGERVWREQAGVRADVERLVQMWTGLLTQYGGPCLMGSFSMADAYFAPVCMRLHTYALPLPAHITTYVGHVRSLPGIKAWRDAALAEKDFLPFEEPYRQKPDWE